MKVALYIRVSTDEQVEEGYSIGAQKSRLTSFCDSQGWEISDFYIDDGKSAKDLERDELKRLLNDIEDESKRIDVVLVYRLDRLTRSVLDLYTLLQKFESHNVKFKSATEVYDTTTAMGRLFITLVAALAQWERENLGERVRFGMEQMVREGKRPGGPIPFGYDKEGRVIEEEAESIRILRELYLGGLGIKSVAEKLNEMNRLRRGKRWTAYGVWYILDNPYYAGKIRWGEKNKRGTYTWKKKDEKVNCIISDSDHETIFTWDEYLEHKEEMKRRSFTGYTQVREYWFSGVLICGKCGHKMSGRYHQNKRKDGTYKKILSYICSNRQTGKGCKMPMFRQELVEHLIMEYIESIRLDQQKLKKINERKKEEKVLIEKERKEIQKQIRQVEERRKKWQYMFVEDLISEDDLRQRKREEDEREVELSEKLEELKSKDRIDNEKLEALINLKDMWTVLSDKERKQIILTIFNRVVLYTPLEKAKGKKGEFIPASILEIKYN